MSQIRDFTIEFVKWRAAGYPLRAPEWVRGIFDDYCSGCEAYRPEERNLLGARGLCEGCGCHVSPEIDDSRNMLLYPTKGCPKGYFLPVVDSPTEDYRPKLKKEQ